MDGYGSEDGTYWMEVSTMLPPAAKMFNVWKDGNLTADELADTVLTYTDYNVTLIESEYTVNASLLMVRRFSTWRSWSGCGLCSVRTF